MDLRVHQGPDGAVFVGGELDLASFDAFEAAVVACLQGQDPVVLDLTDVTFVDSTGIRAFVWVAREIAPRRLVLRNPTPPVQKVLQIVRIDTILGIAVRSE